MYDKILVVMATKICCSWGNDDEEVCLKTVSKRLIIDIMILNMHGNVCWIPQGIQLLYL